jgi:hypothetical protein
MGNCASDPGCRPGQIAALKFALTLLPGKQGQTEIQTAMAPGLHGCAKMKKALVPQMDLRWQVGDCLAARLERR